MERSKIAILIPAFNEKKTIKKVVKSCLRFGFVVVVDDGSTDGTKQILKNLKNKYLKIIKNEKNIGYEKSLQKGFEYLKKKKFEMFITFDADDQFFIKDLKKIINYLLDGNDIVIGKRIKFQRISEYIVSYMSRLMLNIYDPLCGLKGYNNKIIKKNNFLDKNGYSGTEILFNSVIKNVKIKQFKIRTKSRLDQTRFGSSISTELYLLKILFLILVTYFRGNK